VTGSDMHASSSTCRCRWWCCVAWHRHYVIVLSEAWRDDRLLLCDVRAIIITCSSHHLAWHKRQATDATTSRTLLNFSDIITHVFMLQEAQRTRTCTILPTINLFYLKFILYGVDIRLLITIRPCSLLQRLSAAVNEFRSSKSSKTFLATVNALVSRKLQCQQSLGWDFKGNWECIKSHTKIWKRLTVDSIMPIADHAGCISRIG